MEIEIKYPICSDYFHTVRIEDHISLEEWEAMTQEEKNAFVEKLSDDLFNQAQSYVDGGFSIEYAYGWVDENGEDQDFE